MKIILNIVNLIRRLLNMLLIIMRKWILGRILLFIIKIKLLKRLAFFFFYSIIEFNMGDAFMSQVYTGIELGTDSIKIVVLEKLQNKFHVLASVHSPSEGISKGQVVDIKKCVKMKNHKEALKLLEKFKNNEIKTAIAHDFLKLLDMLE